MLRGRVLVVDDNPELRALLREALRAASYDVRTAANGRVALRVLETFVPDILLVDVEMPEMDGRELVAALRARGEIPFAIVAMSGGVHESASPSPCFLRKPFEVEALLGIIHEFSRDAQSVA